jgi:hypothetical protein
VPKAIGSRWRSLPTGRIVVLVLAGRAPRLDRALKKITRAGGEVVLLDGTLIRTRRRSGQANRRNYSGKHRSHGLLFLALTDERRNLIWISSARRGAASEIKTARHDHIVDHLKAAGLGALADLGFVGLDQDRDATPWSSPGPNGPAPRSSPPARRPPTKSSPPPAPPSNTASPP